MIDLADSLLNRIILLPYSYRNRNCAFSNCINLNEVVMNDGLQKIEKYAFNSCRVMIINKHNISLYCC